VRLAQRHVLFREPNNLTPIGMRALEAGKKRLKCMAKRHVGQVSNAALVQPLSNPAFFTVFRPDSDRSTVAQDGRSSLADVRSDSARQIERCPFSAAFQTMELLTAQPDGSIDRPPSMVTGDCHRAFLSLKLG